MCLDCCDWIYLTVVCRYVLTETIFILDICMLLIYKQGLNRYLAWVFHENDHKIDWGTVVQKYAKML